MPLDLTVVGGGWKVLDVAVPNIVIEFPRLRSINPVRRMVNCLLIYGETYIKL